MPDLLLELYSEEIPARMQEPAAKHLHMQICENLDKAGLPYKTAQTYYTPRRLTLHITGLAKQTKETVETKRGPKTTAPEKAIEGFMKASGLTDISQAQVQGEHYFAIKKIKGRQTKDILPEIIKSVLAKFQWQKSMKWGTSNFRWVRPLQSILCILDSEIINFEIENIKTSNKTKGHIFYNKKPFAVKNFIDYEKQLKNNFVILCADERKQAIKDQVKAKNLKLKMDEKLLDEVTNLVEYPVVLLGEFDKSYLELPAEIIRTTISENQKCFVIDGQNKFLIVANIKAKDDKEIIKGNAKVVNARLADAKFFYEADLAEIKKHGFKNWNEQLKNILFHNKLGSQKERIERVAKFAVKINSYIGADEEKVLRAVEICKADLCSTVVGEFPNLQGIMGRIYAEKFGENISLACENHYKPRGPSDKVPTDDVSIVVALADKFDTLCQFWKIDEKPTGSKDPFALRRAALGIIRIISENNIKFYTPPTHGRLDNFLIDLDKENKKNLLSFFSERLKVYWRDLGKRHDLIDAVLADEFDNSIFSLEQRLAALENLTRTKKGKKLIDSAKRVANFLDEQEKQQTTLDSNEQTKEKYNSQYNNIKRLLEKKEMKLVDANNEFWQKMSEPLATLDFSTYAEYLICLTEPLDYYFENVMIRSDDEKGKKRLELFVDIHKAMGHLADFSKIEG